MLLPVSLRLFQMPRLDVPPLTPYLLVGLIVANWAVFSGFQVSQFQGLIALLLAIEGYFFWVLYVWITLEFLVAICCTADNIARVSTSSR